MRKVKVSLYGGLGNQLFQYSAGLALAKRLNYELILDLSWFEHIKGSNVVTVREYALSPLNLEGKTFIGNLTVNRIQRILYKLFKLSSPSLPTFEEKHYHFDGEYLKINRAVHLKGYWQSYKYFQTIATELRESICSNPFTDVPNRAMQENIAAVNAVCLHIRRGDYVTNPDAASTHGICDLTYYENGISVLKEYVSNPHGFIFSDDPKWVVGNMNISIPYTVVDINSANGDAYKDLLLMASCKHFIIANSTFSWWGAWLSNYSNKKVVAPQKWFAKGEHLTEDLLPSDWIRI